MDVHLEVRGDLSVLRLRPGDILVVTTPQKLTMEQAHAVREEVKARFPDPYDVVIFSDGADLSVVSAQEVRQ